jgi:transcriptional regulator with XRE-family HTH domain
MTPGEMRRLRARLRLTQVELGERLGLHPMTISKFERGVEPIQKQTALALELLARIGKQRRRKK